jgi:hypothetical protein
MELNARKLNVRAVYDFLPAPGFIAYGAPVIQRAGEI